MSPEPFGPRAQSPTVKRAKRLWGREWLKGKLAAARGLGLLLYESNMAGGRYAYPYGPSPTDESLKLRVLDDEKHFIVFD